MARPQLEGVIEDRRPACGRVLLIYCGGTMGMTMQDGALSPLKGYLPERIREMPEVHEPSMPELDILEYDPLIDSSDVGPDDWALLVTQIREHYYDYDGFVVVHGTDTMAYTASALSFMLEGLGKAVVLTGSMIPLAAVHSDGRRNLLISMIFAAQLELCEVAIFFNDHLLRGNRATKLDSNGLDAFASPNHPPLATVGVRLSAERAKWRGPPVSRLRVHTRLETNVVVFHLVPGFDDRAIGALVREAEGLKGIVLSLYGTGNGGSKSAFLRVIADAISKGILVAAASQVHKGRVSLETYEVGRQLLELGVVSAADMTKEAVVAKMAYLFGRGVCGAQLADAMSSDLRGELTEREEVRGVRARAEAASGFESFLGFHRGAAGRDGEPPAPL